MNETEVGVRTAIPVMEIADAKGRAGLTQPDHPNSDKRVTTPGANLLNPEESIAKLVDTGFPLDAVGLVNSMFAGCNDASGTTQEGGNPLRGEVDDDVPGGGDSSRKGGVNMLSTSASKVAGTRADRGDSSGQAGKPTLARFRG